MVSGTALADSTILTNGISGVGAKGCPNATITMSNGETIYWRACTYYYGLQLTIWRYATGEAFSITEPNVYWVGDVLTTDNAPAYDGLGHLAYYVSFHEKMTQVYVRSGGGRAGGNGGYHWQDLGGGITFTTP